MFKGGKQGAQATRARTNFCRDIQLEIMEWHEGEQELQTKWRFSAILDLPWRPRLAAAGGTTHVFNPETGRVCKHIEAWDVQPGRVVRELLRPSSKVPESFAEVLMNSVYEGDVRGIWFALSGHVMKLSAVAGGLLLLLSATAAPEGGTTAVAVMGLLFVAAGVTEVVKFAEGMQGGDTGTGGRF
jgi:hypothetical protein